MAHPRITLEQWRALQAVVEHGSYARAAEALHKSQTSITYAIQKLERLLNVRVLVLKGRRAELTPAGQALYRRARVLLEEAAALEGLANGLESGFEPELRVAADVAFPERLLIEAVACFHRDRPMTSVELFELPALSIERTLVEGRVDLAVTTRLSPGFVGEHLMRLRLIAVAAPSHPLHRLGRPVGNQDLRQHDEVTLRDTLEPLPREPEGRFSHQCLRVNRMTTIMLGAMAGLGIAWLPESLVRPDIESGRLKPLPLGTGVERYTDFFLVLALGELAPSNSHHLAKLLREVSARSEAAMKLDRSARIERPQGHSGRSLALGAVRA